MDKLNISSRMEGKHDGSNWVNIPKNYPSLVEKYTSCRWRISYMATTAFMLVQMMRQCTSFAVVCMTGEATGVGKDTLLNISNFSSGTPTTEIETVGEFDYSSETQGLLISSVFYAGIFSPFAGSLASRKYGPKKVVATIMTIGGVMMLLTPTAARTHVYLFVACRVITGFTVTMLDPITPDLWVHWAPHEEKVQLLGYSLSGYPVGATIMFALSGIFCKIPVDNGWPFIFYIFGTCTVVWCLTWHITVYDKPENHPRITPREKRYIMLTRSQVNHNNEITTIPWKDIITTKGVWAFVLALCCHAWTSSVLLSYLPLYMATVLNFDVRENGVLSSLPFLARVLGTLVWGNVSTYLVKCMSLTNTRKLVQCTGFLCAAGLTISLCYLGEGQEYIAVTIFVLTAPFQTVIFNAGIVTPLDMAPQYASLISSVGVFFGTVCNIISPLITSYIIKDRTREQWAIVFYLNAGLYVFSSLVFLLYGSGQLQPWADDSSKHNETKYYVNAAFVSNSDEITHM